MNEEKKIEQTKKKKAEFDPPIVIDSARITIRGLTDLRISNHDGLRDYYLAQRRKQAAEN